MITMLPFVAAAGLIVVGVVQLFSGRRIGSALLCLVMSAVLTFGGMNYRMGGSVDPCTAVANYRRAWVDLGLSPWECQRIVVDHTFTGEPTPGRRR